ncbi:thrombospondin type-1 domain-containing protein 7A [Cricetulus griseus]|nr:thrombospondin type-1 domain-containing protein 7A [Cricetulus griseus]
MGLRAGRLASRSRGVLQLLRLPVLLLLLLSSGARGAAAQGDAEVPTLYLWKTVVRCWSIIIIHFWSPHTKRYTKFLKTVITRFRMFLPCSV